MRYPKLTELNTERKMVDVFRGYNHNLRISDNEFFDMKNMTSDYYPVLSPRGKRGVYTTTEDAAGALIAKEGLCYFDGDTFYINDGNDGALTLPFTNNHRRLIAMGSYVIILPDKYYVNEKNVRDNGEIEYSANLYRSRIEPCHIDDGIVSEAKCQETAPENPSDKQYWLDTSSVPNTLKRYSTETGIWASIPSSYVKISGTNYESPLQDDFSVNDGVTISGFEAEEAKIFNGSSVLQAVGDNYIVVSGSVKTVVEETNTIKISRVMPEMDFVFESGNRLWGCRYGLNRNGEFVNEIYASKMGDFRNWNYFAGTSMDSYAASVGTDGPFTGAIEHMGYPLFFKENCVHKVYGNYPANYQIQTTACRGVQKGCDRSLAIVNETLFYKSRSAVCAYDGSLPTEVSYALGNESYSDAVGGASGNKYYISMKDVQGIWHLFVYDTAKGMWHKEDNFHADAFCSWMGELYGIDHDTKKIVTMQSAKNEPEGKVKWMVETGEIGISTADMKYISRLTVRMSLDMGTEVRFYAQYDFSDEWAPLFALRSTNLRSFSIPIRPKRCDHMKVRIEGVGGAKIYSLTKTIEQGSDIS